MSGTPDSEVEKSTSYPLGVMDEVFPQYFYLLNYLTDLFTDHILMTNDFQPMLIITVGYCKETRGTWFSESSSTVKHANVLDTFITVLSHPNVRSSDPDSCRPRIYPCTRDPSTL